MKRILAVLAVAAGLILSTALAAAPASAAPATGSTAAVPASAPAAVTITAVQSSLAITTARVTVTAEGRSFSARLVQPAAAAPGGYPVVAFGHGFVQSSSRYTSTLEGLAARGYVVIAPDSEAGLFPNHSRFADDLWRAIAWVRATQPNASQTLGAVAGHSMGGGAALIAADRHPELQAVATEAAAETNPSATTASAGIAVPALYVVGSADGVVSPASTRGMYNAKPSPATLATITGGYHCGFVDSSSFFGIGCDRGQISRSTQLPIAAALLGNWFDHVLKGAPTASVPAGVVVEST
ncbi:alpha/beta hydrolase [Rathayibacter sp. YIM 133350]|uniref:alpha/beta hydrolase n=1 Tax=Rathayibacter sp. YIM 133350 TaxID=3131992 RepID=UPI00307E2E3B